MWAVVRPRRFRRPDQAMKQVAVRIKLELAQYAKWPPSPILLGSRRLDPRLLARARLTELLKQPQFTPYPVEEQVVSIFAGVARLSRPGRGRRCHRFEQGC